MRRTIRLTGRKQLDISSLDFDIRDVGASQMVILGLAAEVRNKFPADARIRVKLVENKRVEICDFGTIGNPKTDVDIGTLRFHTPSCQVRISSSQNPEGLLLASTSVWTFKTGDDPEGILIFQSMPIAPKIWDLEIRPEEYPLLKVDDRIEDAANWAGSSPIFGALVFPSVLREIFRHILTNNGGSRPDGGWMLDWMKLADDLIGQGSLPQAEDYQEIDKWCDRLIDTFLAQNGIGDKAVVSLRTST
jgi:hypothetical protein